MGTAFPRVPAKEWKSLSLRQVAIGFFPALHGVKDRLQAFSELGKRIFRPGRHLCAYLAKRYRAFLHRVQGKHVLFLELAQGQIPPRNHQISLLADDGGKPQGGVRLHKFRGNGLSGGDQKAIPVYRQGYCRGAGCDQAIENGKKASSENLIEAGKCCCFSKRQAFPFLFSFQVIK